MKFLNFFVNHNDVNTYCEELFHKIMLNFSATLKVGYSLKVYPIPRGGVPVAYALKSVFIQKGKNLFITNNPEECDFIIDDIIDSGQTADIHREKFMRPVFALFTSKPSFNDYCGSVIGDEYWVVFPWENEQDGGFETVEQNITRLIQSFGEDPSRQGLLETPKRVAKAWKHWMKGYTESAPDILKVFEDGAEAYDEMVTVKDIPFYSHCEHHMAPIFGTATVSYIPDGKIVGLSKISRLVDMFARRLQVQERLTSQIADSLMENLKPKGVGVHIRARHMCMESRGVCQQGHHTITTALRGVIKNVDTSRAEFLNLAK